MSVHRIPRLFVSLSLNIARNVSRGILPSVIIYDRNGHQTLCRDGVAQLLIRLNN